MIMSKENNIIKTFLYFFCKFQKCIPNIIKYLKNAYKKHITQSALIRSPT